MRKIKNNYFFSSDKREVNTKFQLTKRKIK